MIELNDIFEIEISDDHLKAYVKLKSTANEQVSLDEIEQFINEHGIKYGIHQNIVEDMKDGKVTSPVIVAEGKKAVDGEDAYLKPIIPLNKNENIALDDTVKVDLKQVIEIPSVTQGTVVGEKVPSKDGISGMNVLGVELKPKPGKDMKLRPGKNTRINKEGTKVIATVDGQLSVDRKVIHVYPVYEVNGDLDLKVGNIDFVGNVNIRGNVPEGFRIKAAGDIRIHGSVEGVTLEAGGSIFIHQGVVAQGKGIIEAKGDFTTSFINQGNVRVSRDVVVSQSILHSHIEAQGYVYCKHGRGNIVGGSISAGKGIEVNEVGNNMNTPTSLYLGIGQHAIEKEKLLKVQLETLQSDVQKLGLLYKKLIQKEKQSQLSSQDRIMKLRVQNSFKETQQNIEEIKDELADLEVVFQSQSNSQIRIFNELYPNTNIHFGKYRRKIVTKHKYVMFRLDQREISFESL
ncbi:DUF342 domain-containing protein [Evansella halocellulosilytica]|uniref:DUF342 domain-containing protein n=1 Tax=Evansella halocellulosilytica TaxID=2011013 RepID=UPI0015C86716|nr:FapA family protein [Evansella halocellulosilytica]